MLVGFTLVKESCKSRRRTCGTATYRYVSAVSVWKMPSGRAVRAFPCKYLRVSGERQKGSTAETLLGMESLHLQWVWPQETVCRQA